MDVLSLIGIIMAFVAIIGGNYLEGGHLGALALSLIHISEPTRPY